jgi:flagellin
VAAAINAKSSQTGVTATSNTTTGAVSLKAADGRNITISTTTAGAAETGLTTSANATTTLSPNAITATAALATGDLNINGVDIGPVAAVASSTIAEHTARVAAAINLKTYLTGVSAASDGTSKVNLTSANGKAITTFVANSGGAGTGFTGSSGTRTVTAAAGLTTTADTHKTAQITLSTNSSTGIVIGGATGAAATGQSVGFSASVLSSSGGVDLSTAAGSQAALSVLDTAINTITDSRASMGAYQNRLTASVANLETTAMNLQASRSRILDTDYAKETTNLAKSQIIQQAATAMLAQANQSAQSVLSLLK